MYPSMSLDEIPESRVPRSSSATTSAGPSSWPFSIAPTRPSGPSSDKPDFDKQILKIGAHYWPLIAKCNMKHQGDAYDSLIVPAFREHVRWVLRKAVIHGALVSTSEGWKRTPGTRFLDEKEAGEWRNKMSVGSPPRIGRAELKDRLERIGQERQEHLDRLQKAADEEGALWAQI
ncbi:hypothetical protein LCI18_013949 [Fusarium solani-melongenae]|uniref:Uncharacterized protein n=1 Tax=Fusarium solani subsp. cucurbitae TaxID=2747967 RepID=A0ACD3ZNU5_FUSSC|nr:hypothetical protein LCI18_013949 [Fusarium solani-melongenae]